MDGVVVSKRTVDSTVGTFILILSLDSAQVHILGSHLG